MAIDRSTARWAAIVTAAILCGAALPQATAEAAELELATAASQIPVGQRFSILVSGVDFPNGVDGGDLSLFWSDNLAFVGFTIESQPWETSAANLATSADHYIGSIDVFSADDTPGEAGARFPIARLTLEAQAEGPARIDIGGDLVGWSVDGDPVGYALAPGIDLDVVPLPEPLLAATIAAGVGLLGAFGRGRGRGQRRGGDG